MRTTQQQSCHLFAFRSIPVDSFGFEIFQARNEGIIHVE
jgi:hypothetical protein